MPIMLATVNCSNLLFLPIVQPLRWRPRHQPVLVFNVAGRFLKTFISPDRQAIVRELVELSDSGQVNAGFALESCQSEHSSNPANQVVPTDY